MVKALLFGEYTYNLHIPYNTYMSRPHYLCVGVAPHISSQAVAVGVGQRFVVDWYPGCHGCGMCPCIYCHIQSLDSNFVVFEYLLVVCMNFIVTMVTAIFFLFFFFFFLLFRWCLRQGFTTVILTVR